MTSIYEILRRPIITEKSNYQQSALDQYVFEVDPKATKAMIKDAVEALFEVKVVKVNVLNMPSKRGRNWQNRSMVQKRSGYKKAIITLSPGDKIDIFEGVK